jgi:mannose-1-phosphate guanylyltransferase
VGVEGLIIVDTEDALLVAKQEDAQKVKNVVKILKESGSDLFKTHKTVSRPWGSYKVIGESPGFKIKRLEVKPRASLSLQRHQHRSEHWVVVLGEATVISGDAEFVIKDNESTYIPSGQMHRLENKTDDDLIIIEVQCGTYLGEDDIERFDDKYGR